MLEDCFKRTDVVVPSSSYDIAEPSSPHRPLNDASSFDPTDETETHSFLLYYDVYGAIPMTRILNLILRSYARLEASVVCLACSWKHARILTGYDDSGDEVKYGIQLWYPELLQTCKDVVTIVRAGQDKEFQRRRKMSLLSTYHQISLSSSSSLFLSSV